MSWYEEEEKPVTVKELNTLCVKYNELKKEAAEIGKKKAEVEKEASKIQHQIIEHLEENKMKNHSGEFGTISVTNRYSVKQPQGDEKDAFFKYLRDTDQFDIVSVNSRTLTSFVKQEIEAKKSEGVYNWVPPGISEPETVKTLSLRKK